MTRKRRPNSPSINLANAVERISKVFEKEGNAALPTSVIAQDLGYTNATSGAALTTIASLKYFGLLENSEKGILAVTDDFNEYAYNPDELVKSEVIKKWALTPKVFESLFNKFPEKLPSDNALRYELIKIGFSEDSANSCLKKFKETIEFAKIYNDSFDSGARNEHVASKTNGVEKADRDNINKPRLVDDNIGQHKIEEIVRIPVRLKNKRIAYLELPSPFLEIDKEMLVKQIEIIICDDES